MRYRAFLPAILLVVACGRGSPPPNSVAQGPVAPTQEVIEFLLTAAATDFDAHRPPDPVGFRNVRLGHVLSAGGEPQYLICGELLPAGPEQAAGWVPFATIRTSAYEQWVGVQATGLCANPALVLDDAQDLSLALQQRLESLRK